jgi:hypothetical protein
MPAAAALVLAQHSQSAPSDGVGAGLIIGAVLLVLLIAAAIFFAVSRTTRASRGGVASPLEERPPGEVDPVLRPSASGRSGQERLGPRTDPGD